MEFGTPCSNASLENTRIIFLGIKEKREQQNESYNRRQGLILPSQEILTSGSHPNVNYPRYPGIREQ